MPTPITRRRQPPSPAEVERVRVLVEGTSLSQGAIVRASGVGLRWLRRLMAENDWRRPLRAPSCPRDRPAILARMQGLFEGTTMTQRAIARELGVSPGHVSLTARRHGWVRPGPDEGRTVATRWPKRPGRPFRADVIPQVRDLYTGTILPLKAIAARTGVSFAYVSKLGRRHGWVRPAGAPTCPRDVAPGRASLGRRLREARRRVSALAESWAAAWAEAGAPDLVARARDLAAAASARGP